MIAFLSESDSSFNSSSDNNGRKNFSFKLSSSIDFIYSSFKSFLIISIFFLLDNSSNNFLFNVVLSIPSSL